MYISLQLYFAILAIITMLTTILINNNNIAKKYKMFMLVANIVLYVISAASLTIAFYYSI